MTRQNINKAEFFGEDFSGATSEVFPEESCLSTKILTPPKSVGCWDSGGGVKVMMTKRPNWFHQKMTYIFFGWKWTDYQ